MAALNHQKDGGIITLTGMQVAIVAREALNHRDLQIWLREHGVIQGKRGGQAATILLNMGNNINQGWINRRLRSAAPKKNRKPLPSFQTWANSQTYTPSTEGEEGFYKTTQRVIIYWGKKYSDLVRAVRR